MITARRAAREAALAVLFTADAARLKSADEALALFRENLRDDPEVVVELFGDDDEPAEPEALIERAGKLLRTEGKHWQFVERLVRGVFDHAGAIDDLVQRCSQNWKLKRMNRVDRNILRMAAFELAFEAEVPGRATLNEAIELAKRFGTEDSSKFVNGILDRIAQDLDLV